MRFARAEAFGRPWNSASPDARQACVAYRRLSGIAHPTTGRDNPILCRALSTPTVIELIRSSATSGFGSFPSGGLSTMTSGDVVADFSRAKRSSDAFRRLQ
jgi:hypothetical protein